MGGIGHELRKFSSKERFFWRRKDIRNQKTALELNTNKSNIHTDGKHAGIQWHKIGLDPSTHTFMQDIYDFLGTDQSGVCVFYYLSPGAALHAH